jgi:quinol monooxygenase YgiN
MYICIYIGVKIVFPTIEAKETFINDFIPVAEYVRKYELTTISYELLLSDKDKLLIYILERYVNKKAYLEIHKKSNEFLTFREKFQKLINDGAKVDGESYVETNIGFV